MEKLYVFPSISLAERFPIEENVDDDGFYLDESEVRFCSVYYPVPMNLHYIPVALTKLEMMKVAISWGNTKIYDSESLCGECDLCSFLYNIERAQREGAKIIVVHAQDANSILLLYTLSSLIDGDIYHIDVTPADYVQKFRETTEDDWVDILSEEESHRQYDPEVFSAEDVTIEQAKTFLGKEKLVTPEERKTWRQVWNHWGGEDAHDFPILVDQDGNLFHPYDVYLNRSIFNHTPTDAPATVGTISEAVAKDHPQVEWEMIVSHVVKMANQMQIKWIRRADKPEENEVIQYRTDIAGRWNKFEDIRYLQHFAEFAGKKLSLSDEDIEAEIERMNQDSKDLWGKGHLHREAKQQERDERDQRMLIKWAMANNENWGWYHLMAVMKTKLEMMVDYMRNWSPAANGIVYADQMERAIALMEIIIAWGGEHDYPHTEDEEDYFDADHFAHRVNFHNQDKYPSPDYDGHHFWCEAQRVRFDKAWNILWEMFRTKLITWND